MSQSIDHQNANALLAKLALIILFVAVGAFALKAAIHTERLARYTPLVILHGATMTAWFTLFASQAHLAAKGTLAKHRAWGRWSWLVVVAMVVSGMTVSWNLSQEAERYDVLIGNTGIFLRFLPLYVAAIIYARAHKHAEHRQAMLIGSLALMGPAYGRVTDVLGLSNFFVIPFDVVITFAAAIWLDYTSHGRVAASTWWMLSYNLAALAAMVVIVVTFALPA